MGSAGWESRVVTQFSEFDFSPAARDVMREATRAGVTCESIGGWMNLAARWSRLGKTADAAQCAARAIAIHETWGARHATYSMAEGTLRVAQGYLMAEG
jgi:hypothetical protein